MFVNQILSLILCLMLAACNGSGSSQDFGMGATGTGTGTTPPPADPNGTTTPTGPKFFSLFSGNNQNVGVGQLASLPLSVLAKDADGNPVVGATVTFQFTNSLMGTLSSYVVSTDAQGLATTQYTASGAVGAVNVVATAPFGSVIFNLTNLGPSTYTISLVSGSGQSGEILGSLGNSLRVLVTDSGMPIEGVKIKFQSVGGKQGTFNNNQPSIEVFTNSSGIADSGIFRLGELAGLYSINAQMVGDTGQIASFAATGILPANQALSTVNTTLTASHTTRIADGVNSIVYTLTLKDVYGNTLNKSLGDVNITFNPNQALGCDFAQSWLQLAPGVFTKTIRTGVLQGNISYFLAVDGQIIISSIPTLSLVAVQVIDLAQTTITSSVTSLTADGVSLALITVKLRNSLGQVIDDPNFLTTPGNSIAMTASLGTYVQTGVTYNVGGSFDIALRSPTSVGVGSTLLSTTVTTGGSNVTKTLSLPLTGGTLSLAASGLFPPVNYTTAWNAAGNMTIPIYLKDSQNNSVDLSGATVTITKVQSIGTYASAVTAVTKVGVGSYMFTLTPPGSCPSAPSTPCLDTLTAYISHPSINGGAATQLGTQKFIYHAGTSVTPSTATSTFVPVGVSYAEAINGLGVQYLVTLRNAGGVQIPVGGFAGGLTFDTTNVFTKSVVDNLNGTYLVTIGASTTPMADTVTAKYAGVAIGSARAFYFYGQPTLANSVFTLTSYNLDGTGSVTGRMYLRDSASQYIPVSAINTSDVTFSLSSGLGAFSTAVLKSTDALGVYFERTYLRSDTPIIKFESEVVSVSLPSWGGNLSRTLTIKPKNLSGVSIDCNNIASYKGKYLYVDSGTLSISTWWNGGRPNTAGCADADAFDFYGLKIGPTGTVTSPWPDKDNTYGIDINLLTEGLEIETGGKIDVSGRGYKGGYCPAGTVDATMPTLAVPPRTVDGTVLVKNYSVANGDYSGGGSFGSFGNVTKYSGNNSPNALAPLLYGNFKNVNHPGSGGGAYVVNTAGNCLASPGGNGGGLVRLKANKALINGSIVSRTNVPGMSTNSYAGSGGGIHIEISDAANKLDGSGLLDVYGGGSGPVGGGGGRISILGALGTFKLKNFLLNSGWGVYEHNPGTLYISEPISGAQEIVWNINLGLKGIYNRSEITFDPSVDLTLKNGSFVVTDMPLVLNSLTLENGSILTHNSTYNGLTDMANQTKLPRVEIDAVTINIQGGSKIDASRKGYPGGYVNTNVAVGNDITCGSGPIDFTNPELGYKCYLTTSTLYDYVPKVAYTILRNHTSLFGGSHYNNGGCQYKNSNSSKNITWGDPGDPNSPGGGAYNPTANFQYYLNNTASGGGIIRLKADDINIAGNIIVNGGAASAGAAAGSIKLDTKNISILNASLISAKGGAAPGGSISGGGTGGLVYIGYETTNGVVDPSTLDAATIATGGSSALNAYTDYCTQYAERVGQNGVVTVIDYIP
jgi:hypothetical protein